MQTVFSCPVVGGVLAVAMSVGSVLAVASVPNGTLADPEGDNSAAMFWLASPKESSLLLDGFFVFVMATFGGVSSPLLQV